MYSLLIIVMCVILFILQLISITSIILFNNAYDMIIAVPWPRWISFCEFGGFFSKPGQLYSLRRFVVVVVVVF